MLSAMQIAQLAVRTRVLDSCTICAERRRQALMIANAEASGNVSSRDGVLMKRLPEGSRFGSRGLVQYLQVRRRRPSLRPASLTSRVQDAMVGNEALARESMSAHFGHGLATTHGTRGRHALYALRSIALVRAGKPALALKVRDVMLRCSESRH